MLKHVLAGNCINMMLACLNPAEQHVSESHNTLRSDAASCPVCPVCGSHTPLPSLVRLPLVRALRYAQRASNMLNQTRTQSYDEMQADDPMRCAAPARRSNAPLPTA